MENVSNPGAPLTLEEVNNAEIRPPQAPNLNSFQLKHSNENIIARLMQTGLFQSKQHLLQAALMCLFADMQRAFKAAEAKAKPTTEQIAEKFLQENRPLMEDLAAAEQAEKAASEPNTNLQD